MSELRVALVAEGPTDRVIVEAALRATLKQSFVLSLLQPEATSPDMGTGWGGVWKWCSSVKSRGPASITQDPTLEFFDLLILHLDADVADRTYADYGPNAQLEAEHAGLQTLPCSQPCPPVDASIKALILVLQSWLGATALGERTVLCIPSKCVEAWIAAAILPAGHAKLDRIECADDMGTRLAQLPKKIRIAKRVVEYREISGHVERQWSTVRALCSSADTFQRDVLAAVARLAF